MILPQYRDTPADLEKKYGASYIKYDGQLVLCHQFMPSPEQPGACMAIISINKVKSTINFDPDLVEVLNFNSQLFNLPVSLAREWKTCLGWTFIRRARRQNCKGLNAQTCTLYSFKKLILPKYANQKVYDVDVISPKVIEGLMKPMYYSLKESLRLCDEFYSVALSPDFGIYLHHTKPDCYLLASKYGFIGELDYGCITVYHKGSYQEVLDFRNRSQLALPVFEADAPIKPPMESSTTTSAAGDSGDAAGWGSDPEED